MASKKKKASKVEAVPSQPMSDWEHEDNARTLMKAGEIMADPKKMKGAQKHLKKQRKAMRSVKDLVDYRNQKYGAKGAPKIDMEPDQNDPDETSEME